jgi:hypothetical protein
MRQKLFGMNTLAQVRSRVFARICMKHKVYTKNQKYELSGVKKKGYPYTTVVSVLSNVK